MVTQSYYPFLDRGGQAVTVRALAQGLAGRGHRVTVLTADLSGGKRGDLGERTEWGWDSREQNVETVYLRTALTFHALTVNPALGAFCRERLAGFDVVHLYGLYDLMGPKVSRLSQGAQIPYLLEPMGMFRPIDRAFFLKWLWRKIYGNRLLQDAWRIIATSELEKGELIQGGIAAERVLLRYNPVDRAEYARLPARGTFRRQWKISGSEPLVLFLGRLIPRKGADLLIQAFADAMPGGGTLVIVGPEGNPGYVDQLRAVARQSGVADRVRFTGGLYGEAQKAVLADADIFALPSSYENFANAVAEAVASGVPVVVTDRCGIHSLVDGRAGLVVRRDRQALAQALGELWSNRALMASLRAGCRAVAEELSVERIVAQQEAFYASRPRRSS
ncbi:MAG TPA: glycosyltransferase [Candidatus Acidoferrales bacterium]|nr:glycosyltransferase [Candidatus Acidoferrales bacterium]